MAVGKCLSIIWWRCLMFRCWPSSAAAVWTWRTEQHGQPAGCFRWAERPELATVADLAARVRRPRTAWLLLVRPKVSEKALAPCGARTCGSGERAAPDPGCCSARTRRGEASRVGTGGWASRAGGASAPRGSCSVVAMQRRARRNALHAPGPQRRRRACRRSGECAGRRLRGAWLQLLLLLCVLSAGDGRRGRCWRQWPGCRGNCRYWDGTRPLYGRGRGAERSYNGTSDGGLRSKGGGRFRGRCAPFSPTRASPHPRTG